MATSNVSRSTTTSSADRPPPSQRESSASGARENSWARRVVTRPLALSCARVSASAADSARKAWHCRRKVGWFSFACTR